MDSVHTYPFLGKGLLQALYSSSAQLVAGRTWVAMALGHAGTCREHCGTFGRKAVENPAQIAFYPLVNIQKTMENQHAINGKIHYFHGHFQVRKLLVITRPGNWKTDDQPLDFWAHFQTNPEKRSVRNQEMTGEAFWDSEECRLATFWHTTPRKLTTTINNLTPSKLPTKVL